MSRTYEGHKEGGVFIGLVTPLQHLLLLLLLLQLGLQRQGALRVLGLLLRLLLELLLQLLVHEVRLLLLLLLLGLRRLLRQVLRRQLRLVLVALQGGARVRGSLLHDRKVRPCLLVCMAPVD